MLSSAGGAISAEWAPRFVEPGAVVVDNTSFWRMHDDVPLVVSEVNPDAADDHTASSPTRTARRCRWSWRWSRSSDAVGIERVVVSTYQSVSGTGQKRDRRAARPGPRRFSTASRAAPTVYPHPIAFNVLPQVETFKDGDDYTTEERKMMAETRKILGAPSEELGISATCVRVPVLVGHSRVDQRADARAALAGGVPRAARRRARASSSPTIRPRASTRWRPPSPAATRSWSGGSAATLARALPQPLGRRRQPAQGRRDERRPGRRAARRARPDPGSRPAPQRSPPSRH